MLADTRLARLGRWAAVALTAVTIAGAGAMGIAEAREQGTTLTWSHPQEPPNWDFLKKGSSALMVPVFHNVLDPLVELMGDGSVESLGDPSEMDVNTHNERVDAKQGKGATRSEVIETASQEGFATESYKRVYRDYKSFAQSAMDSDELPEGQRRRVKRYYQMIQPQK